MEDSNIELIPMIIMLYIIIIILFKPIQLLAIIAKMIVLIVVILKWAIIVGLVWSIINSDAIYNTIGFTPISLILNR